VLAGGKPLGATVHVFSKRNVLVGFGAVTLLAGGVAAYGYWSAGGVGSGSATTGTSTAITVIQTSTVAGLHPGDTAQTLSGNFTNATGSPVYVNNVTASISSVVKDPGAVAGTCDATDYTLAGAVMTVGAEVPVGTAQGSWTGATIKFNNKATNQDQCKNATVSLAYVAA
jgi:hypothetical protein